MLDKAQAIKENIIEIRRHIHENPELSYEETETAAYVIKRLKNLGISFKSGVARTGVVAELAKKGEKILDISKLDELPQPIIIVRADMDALPIQENTGLDFASKNQGIMHACGHDTHTAMVLGVIEIAKELTFTGTLRFLFQPSEEGNHNDPDGLSGANRMVKEGVTEGVSAALGIHQIPTMKTGYISLRDGAVMAAADTFKISIKGLATHGGASPELGIDAILIAGELINSLHSIVSRNVSPHDTAVLSLGTIHGGEASNIIADKVIMEGTIRTARAKTRTLMREKAKAVCDHIGQMHKATIEFEFTDEIPLTMNDPKIKSICKQAAEKVVNPEHVIALDTVMGTEDFSYIAEVVPSCFALLGSRIQSGEAFSLHNDKMVVNEDALPIGCAYLAQAALDMLEEFSSH